MVPIEHAYLNPAITLAERRRETPGPALADYAAVVARHKWLVLFMVTLAILVTYVAITWELAEYQGALTIELDRSAHGNVATQLQLLQSKAVLGAAAKRFGTRPAVRISRPEGTSLVRIVCRAPNENLAAAVPNAIVSYYLEMQRQNQFTTWLGAASTADTRLKELRGKMEESERALRETERSMGATVGKRGPLAQLEASHARALADRLDKEAAYDVAKSGSIDALRALADGGATRNLLDRRSEALRKFNELREVFGENHPGYENSRVQVSALDEEVNRARMALLEDALAQLRASRQREGELRDELTHARSSGVKSVASMLKLENAKERAGADRRLYDSTLRKISEAQVYAKTSDQAARIVDSVVVVPIERNLREKCTLAGILTGLPLALFLMLGGAVDPKLRRLADLCAVTTVPVLGVLPSVSSWHGRGEPQVVVIPEAATAGEQPFALAIDTFREGILMLLSAGNGKALLVASPLESDGRSTIAANLGASIARAGKRVLLVDGDQRKPELDRLMTGAKAEAGLTEILEDGAAWELLVIRQASGPELHLLPAGRPARASDEEREVALRTLLREAGKSYDAIVIDCPAFLQCPEAVHLARVVDTVVVAVRAGKTGEAAMHSILGYLRRLKSRVAGIVMNDA